jgi:hypothetical protein
VKEKVVHDPLVDVAKVFLPPLHIKLGFSKKFCQSYEEDDPVFYICSRNSPA